MPYRTSGTPVVPAVKTAGTTLQLLVILVLYFVALRKKCRYCNQATPPYHPSRLNSVLAGGKHGIFRRLRCRLAAHLPVGNIVSLSFHSPPRAPVFGYGESVTHFHTQGPGPSSITTARRAVHPVWPIPVGALRPYPRDSTHHSLSCHSYGAMVPCWYRSKPLGT